MAEPIRNDAEIITGVFGPRPEDPKAAEAYDRATGKVSHSCKLARQDERAKERAKREPEAKLAVDNACRVLNDAHRHELVSQQLLMDDRVRHQLGSVRGMWATVGLALGALLGGGITFAAIDASQKAAFDSAGEYGSRMAVAGASLQGALAPTRCIPGETLPDGRVCPR